MLCLPLSSIAAFNHFLILQRPQRMVRDNEWRMERRGGMDTIKEKVMVGYNEKKRRSGTWDCALYMFAILTVAREGGKLEKWIIS